MEFADDNFKLVKNDGSFFKLVEKSVGKREIASHKRGLVLERDTEKFEIDVLNGYSWSQRSLPLARCPFATKSRL